jgi:LacI family transcriptional regulator
MGATIKDVAERAGVSTTTVSHVINGTRFVSPELRQRILQAMEELDYRPNVLARSLRVGESKTIGLVVPDNTNPFFAEISRVIEDVGFNEGYSVFLCNSDGRVEKEQAYVRSLLSKRVDGVVFITAGGSTEPLKDLTRHDTPVVVVDREVPLSLADLVLLNNKMGGSLATRHLLDLGHRRIACITGPSMLTPSADRVRGYREAMEQAGIALDPQWIVQGDFRPSGGEAGMRQLLGLSEPPTAVFACNDLMAIGALHAIRAAGLRVPQDISLVGFDDIALAADLIPPLTTIAQPIAEMGEIAVRLLLSRINGKRELTQTQRHVLEPRLVQRESTAPPPAD